jgi:hypothetical protein
VNGAKIFDFWEDWIPEKKLGVPAVAFAKSLTDSQNGLIKKKALGGKTQPKIYTVWESHGHKMDKNNNVSFFCLSWYNLPLEKEERR